MPLDIAKTRLQTMKPLPDGAMPYKCAVFGFVLGLVLVLVCSFSPESRCALIDVRQGAS